MGIEVSPATVDDRDATIALWHLVGLTRPWNDPVADFDHAKANQTSDILLARKAGEIIGSAMVGFDGHRGWVYYLAVAEQHRTAGVGRQLMQACEDWLMATDCPKIQLMVRGDNGAARSFYRAIGYEEQDVITIGRRLSGV